MILQALGDYKDAKDLVFRIDMADVRTLMDQGNLQGAYSRIKGYDISMVDPDLMQRLNDAILEQGIKDYESRKYAQCSSYLDLVCEQREAQYYLALVDARLRPSKEAVDKVIAMGNFADAYNVLALDGCIGYFLSGQWTDRDGCWFTLEGKASISYNLPVDHSDWMCFGIKAKRIYLWDGENAAKHLDLFKVTLVDDSHIKLYVYKDRSTHLMERK
jgi:hypothetical protein